MPADIPKNKLLVVSDTSLYRKGGKVYAFGPVARELQELAVVFDEIIWLGCKEHTQLYADTLVTHPNIRCVQMPSVKHKYFNAFFALLAYPVFLFNIFKYSLSATHIHTRGPSHPALLSVLYSFMDSKRAYWHKYAGEWNRPGIPATYRLQRILLNKLRTKINIKITVNASIAEGNIIPFENPALYEDELNEYVEKDYSRELSLLFVGNLTEAKGINNLLSAFQSNSLSNRYIKLIVAGDGDLMGQIKSGVHTGIEVVGYQTREQLKLYYKQCHFLLLPSRSEGFPKVIAEAAAYGCIPVVSDISNISSYIYNGVNGFLMKDISPKGITEKLNSIAVMENDILKQISKKALAIANLFTYERFAKRIQEEVFQKQ